MILAAEGSDAALASAVTALRHHDAGAAYAALRSRGPWFGPSFFTKFPLSAGADCRAVSSAAVSPVIKHEASRKQRVTVSRPADVREAANSEAGGNLSAYAAKALMAQAVRDSAAWLSQWKESRLDTLAELDELQLDTLDELNGGTAA
nr:hypothetical protein [Streptomyces shenzhenensis]